MPSSWSAACWASTSGLIPRTLHCDEPDPELGLDVVRGGSRPTDNPIFVNTNLTRHGQAAALVVRGNPTVPTAGEIAAEAKTDADIVAHLVHKG